jgi:hypothetical protein
MDIETKHKLLDLRKVVMDERQIAIDITKEGYKDAKKKVRDDYLAKIAEIRDEYKDVYAERKTTLINKGDE